MQRLKDYTGSVYGGLGHLLWCYCQAKQIAVPPQLALIQDLERFDYIIWRDVLTELQMLTAHPYLALDIAKHIEPKHLGVLGYLASSSATIGSALTRYYDFHRLLYDGNPLVIEAKGDLMLVRWEVPEALVTHLTNEIAVALVFQFLNRYLRPEQFQIAEIHFTHPAPTSIAYYEQYFRCPVKFQQPYSQLIMPMSVLAQPIVQADQTLQQLLLQQAQHLLAQLPNSTQLDQRLQSAILSGLQQGEFQLEKIAAQLQIQPRQLQRHLQQQGTTFSQRLQEVRLLLAVEYLKDLHLSLNEISLLLGFSEQSAFQRAFRKWTQMTPKQWRKQHIDARPTHK